MSAAGRGTIKVKAFNGQKWIDRDLLDVLFVPGLKYNLFSIPKTLGRGYTLRSTAKECRIMNGQECVAIGEREKYWFIMKLKIKESQAMVARSSKVLTLGE